jgi:aspartate carbamoyltransferase catalytic subunit
MINHFLSLASFSPQELFTLIQRAQSFSIHHEQPDNLPLLFQNKILANVFYEVSTRTRCSFEMAIKRMGGEVINFTPENSSAKKGESVYDTLKTIESLGADAIILRHADDHLLDQIAPLFKTPLVNAGAGKYEHPSQGLLDLITLYQEFGRLEGLNIAICGDVKHSRVAGSLMVAAAKFKMNIFLCGPEDLLPSHTPPYIRKASLDQTLPQIDAIMLLRLQLERHTSTELDVKNYHELFGMNEERQQRLPSHAIILHPGPFNRGIEISSDMVEHPQSRIFKQVTNGVAARMAILEWALQRSKS